MKGRLINVLHKTEMKMFKENRAGLERSEMGANPERLDGFNFILKV